LRHRHRRRTPVFVLLFNYRRRGPGWTCSAFFQTCQRSFVFAGVEGLEPTTHGLELLNGLAPLSCNFPPHASTTRALTV